MRLNFTQARHHAITLLAATLCTACGSTGCSTTKPGHAHSKEMAAVTSFHYNESNTMVANGNEGYDVDLMPDGKVYVLLDSSNPLWGKAEADPCVLDSLKQIVERYKMYNYKKHYEPMFDVHDGTSWSLRVGFADSTSFSSGGYNKWPSNSRAAFGAVTRLLKPYRIHLWEGTYAQVPEDFDYDTYDTNKAAQTEQLASAPFHINVDEVRADSTCAVTVTAKDRYTLQCRGVVTKHEGLQIYLGDVVQGRLPGTPADKSQPLFSIYHMLFIECDDPAALGMDKEIRFVKMMK